MASANSNDSSDQRMRPDSHPHTHFNHLDSEENFHAPAAASPPYRQNMSQLTLPPEYLSTGPSQVDLHQQAGMSDEKRPIDVPRDSDETDDNAMADTGSPRPQSRHVIEGDTLVGTQPNRQHVVRYPDELGVKLPHRQNDHPHTVEGLEQSRSFSGGKQSTLYTEDEASDDDEKYDWSDEHDLVDEEAKFEEKLGAHQAKKKTWGIKRIGTFFLSTLVGSTILAGLIAAIPTVVHFVWYKPHPTSHRRWIADNISAWFYWGASNLLISWYLAAIVNLIPLLTTWIVRTTWGTVTERFKGNVAMYDGFKGWIKPILYVASAWVSWSIIFSGIYGLHDPRGTHLDRAGYTERLQQMVKLLFFVVLMLCCEKILLQIITFTFHRVAFEDRLREVDKSTKVLDHLKEYKPERKTGGGYRVPGINFGRITQASLLRPLNRTRSRGHVDAHVLEDGFAADNDEAPVNETKHNKKRRSSKGWFVGKRRSGPIGTPTEMTPMSPTQPDSARGFSIEDQSYPDAPTSGSSAQPHTYPPNRRSESDADDEGIGAVASTAAKMLKTAMLHDARNIKGKDQTAADLGFAISSPHEAKKLARNLYSAFRGDSRRRHLIPSDFYPAYRTHAEAEEAFKIFDRDGNKDITRAEIKTTIMMVYKERRFLARSLRDVDHALSSLDMILMMFFGIVLFFISLSVFNISIGKSLASIYSLGLAASFIFKSTASNAFDAVIFLFVTHPFDTGDRCFINGENLVVKRMSLFATTFIRADGTQVYYFNSQLFGKFISNIRRSDKMFENLTMQINWRTPLEKLDELEKYINQWMETDENRWYGGSTSCILQHINNQRSLEITMGIPHNSNWQDWGGYLNRRTAFHAAANHYCRKLDITWINSPQPVLVVNPNDKVVPHPSAYEGGNTMNELELPNVDSKEPSSPMAPLPAPKPTLLFQPPAEEYVAGMRHRKLKKNAARGNHGA